MSFLAGLSHYALNPDLNRRDMTVESKGFGERVREFRVYASARLFQLLELELQKLGAPRGVQCELVVRQAIGFDLRFRPATGDHARRFGIAQLLSRENTTMPGDYLSPLVEQDRDCPSEFAHRLGDLLDLLWRMKARVFRIQLQARDRAPLDLVSRP